MASAGARVTIRETTTTTNMQASVLVINTGYLKTKEGFTKLLLLILCAICFTLVLIESHGYSNYHGKSYGYYAGDLFLLLVAFAHLYLTCVMLIACLLYLSTASLLPKISIDFFYHFMACLMFLIAGLWVLIGAYEDRGSSIIAAAVIALIISALHLIHGIFSYRSSKTR